MGRMERMYETTGVSIVLHCLSMSKVNWVHHCFATGMSENCIIHVLLKVLTLAWTYMLGASRCQNAPWI